ncbi:hypothetical protein ABZX85_05000 [Streptomyces sp. NPDC004539]|uniref:hypothetical protein n=1 Tax=Streptomyces sp. NPDC004539 TaxID=3154280 RepID=UPI00339EEAEB
MSADAQLRLRSAAQGRGELRDQPPTTRTREFGSGPLSKAAVLIHTLLTTEALLLITAAPGLIPLFLIGPTPLTALFLLPLGPATSAALYALHHRGTDLTDLHPARLYLQGLRLNTLPALKLWTPLLIWLTVTAFTLTHFRSTGLPTWWALIIAATALTTLLWGAHALILTSLFTFRARDTARLSAYFLLRHGRVTLGALSLLILTGAMTALLTEALPALLSAPLLLSLLHTARPVIAETKEDFTA